MNSDHLFPKDLQVNHVHNDEFAGDPLKIFKQKKWLNLELSRKMK